MKCKKCKKFLKLESSTKDKVGVCKFSASWQAVSANDDCIHEIKAKPLTCGDCFGIEDDYGCMTCKPTDKFACKCSGLRLKFENEIYNYIARLEVSGIDYKKRLNKIIKDYDEYKKNLERRKL